MLYPAALSPMTSVDWAAGPSKFRELDAPVSAEAAVRLHKARIEALTCDLQALQSSLKQKSKSASETEKELQAVQKEKATWQKQMKQLEAQVSLKSCVWQLLRCCKAGP